MGGDIEQSAFPCHGGAWVEHDAREPFFAPGWTHRVALQGEPPSCGSRPRRSAGPGRVAQHASQESERALFAHAAMPDLPDPFGDTLERVAMGYEGSVLQGPPDVSQLGW